MKHSIFKKMLAIYLLVSVSAMILLGLLAAILIARIEADNNEAFLREKLQTFRSMGALVESGELTLAQYKTQVDRMGTQQGYTAYLLPTELGRLQIDSLLEKLSDKNLLNRLPKNTLTASFRARTSSMTEDRAARRSRCWPALRYRPTGRIIRWCWSRLQKRR
jgi:hypothetical protein